MDIEAIRRRVAEGTEPWKTLDELEDSAELTRWLADEFPNRAVPGTASRRDILRLLAISTALAGISGCRGIFMPERHLVPYVQGPPSQTYGKPVTYRSTLIRHGYGVGIEVVTRDGRPIKVEGNPDHMASLGASDAISQAAILQFYDPDRSSAPVCAGEQSTWEAFANAMESHVGGGLRILTETITSPTIGRQIANLKSRVPNARWHAWEPINRDEAYAAAVLAFGKPFSPVYALQNAEIFVGIDFELDRPELGRFAQSRSIFGSQSRIYSIGSTPTLLDFVADHRRALSPPDLHAFILALANAVGVPGTNASVEPWTKALADDLLAARGRCAVAVGESQPAEIQAIGYAINAALGNLGNTLSFVAPPEASPSPQAESLQELASDIQRGGVGCLLILGANPVYHAPGVIDLAAVPFTVHHGLYQDETARLCTWHLPATHEFESWSDARTFDGTASIVQPQVKPIFGGRSTLEVLSLFAGDRRESLAVLRETWQHLSNEEWTEALRIGAVGKPELIVPKLNTEFRPALGIQNANFALFRPHPHIDDGRYVNSGWLQEIPNPHTGLVWDNAILVSPRTAESLGLDNGDHLEVAARSRAVVGPVWITPGHADACVTLQLGFGRTACGIVGDGVGYDAFPLRESNQGFQIVATLRRVDGNTELVSCHPHHRMEGMNLIQTVAQGGAVERTPTEYGFHTLQAKWDQLPGIPQWAMSIDLDRCIGCNACVAACQAENNTPVVGKEQARLGREMHWIRIDRYYAGPDLDNPEILIQPIPCMHCETAPCEPVCPVAATVHSHEGLNEMVYNRCVGTRYCSNNCPYKVRRFNFLDFQLQQPNFAEAKDVPLLRLLNNPDVTVRSRGVMEKCSYCLQRITAARIVAEEEGRPIADGEVVPACAQACPTKTISFGNLADPQSVVHRLRQDPREYPLLPELQTVPRTTYLARIRNANKEMPDR